MQQFSLNRFFVTSSKHQKTESEADYFIKKGSSSKIKDTADDLFTKDSFNYTLENEHITEQIDISSLPKITTNEFDNTLMMKKVQRNITGQAFKLQSTKSVYLSKKNLEYMRETDFPTTDSGIRFEKNFMLHRDKTMLFKKHRKIIENYLIKKK